MPTEEGIGRCRRGRTSCCASRVTDPIPSSVRSVASFSLWEKGDQRLLQSKKKRQPFLPLGEG